MATPLDTGAARLPAAGMFDSIAPRYDLVNRILSFRRDVAWRRRLAARVAERASPRVLDLATGTGDVLLALAEAHAAQMAVGVDLAAEMLALARRKQAAGGAPSSYSAIRGNATRTAFRDAAFDAVTIAFGIRNVTDVPGALLEMGRVLIPGGRVFVLEFSLPRNPLMRPVYLAYFRYVVPMLGGWLGHNRAAYAYLNRSVEKFPSGKEFCAMLAAAGFTDITTEPLTFGIATLYQGVRAHG